MKNIQLGNPLFSFKKNSTISFHTYIHICRATLDLELVGDKVASIIADLDSQAPELKQHMRYPAVQ
jgi:hypothetical protein